MDKREAGEVIVESIRIALDKFEGRAMNPHTVDQLADAIRDELIVLREFGATVSYNTQATARALAELCMMWLMPLDESLDPHLILRKLPDEVLAQILANTSDSSLREQTPFRMIHAEQLFRQGELDEDWEWILLGPSEARVEYSRRNPDKIAINYIAKEDARDWADWEDAFPDDIGDRDKPS